MAWASGTVEVEPSSRGRFARVKTNSSTGTALTEPEELEEELEEELDGRLWAGDVCPQAVRRRDSARAAVKVRKRRIEKPP
jgi:hypothetical protein